MRALLTFTGLGLVALLVATGANAPGPPPVQHPAPTSDPNMAATPAPPALGQEVIDQQDRTSRGRRVVEARMFDTRPLLARLPVERGGVRIDLAGLAADDRTTLLSIDPGTRSRAHARAMLQVVLRDVGDPGTGYRLEWAR